MNADIMNKAPLRPATLLALALFALATGCGQRGPLYLPGSTSEMQPVVPEIPDEPDDEESGDEGGDPDAAAVEPPE